MRSCVFISQVVSPSSLCITLTEFRVCFIFTMICDSSREIFSSSLIMALVSSTKLCFWESPHLHMRMRSAHVVIGDSMAFWHWCMGWSYVSLRYHAREVWQQGKRRNKEEVDYDEKLWVFRLSRLWRGMLGFGLSSSWHILGTLVWHHVSPERMSLFGQASQAAVPLNYGQ